MIYFLKPKGMTGPIKIGFGSKPEDRLSYYSSISPFPLVLVATCDGTIQQERAVHNHFADCLSHGEWFHPVQRLLEAVEKVKSGSSIVDAVDLSGVRGSALSKKQMATRERNGTISKTRKKILDAIEAKQEAAQ